MAPLFAERPEWADEYRSAARFRRHRHAPRPRDKFQRVSGLQSFSNALVTVLTPAAASAVLAFGGLDVVILIDLATFASAFFSLALFIHVPSVPRGEPEEKGRMWRDCLGGMRYLRQNRGILDLILFLAAINLTASLYNAARRNAAFTAGRRAGRLGPGQHLHRPRYGSGQRARYPRARAEEPGEGDLQHATAFHGN